MVPISSILALGVLDVTGERKSISSKTFKRAFLGRSELLKSEQWAPIAINQGKSWLPWSLQRHELACGGVKCRSEQPHIRALWRIDQVLLHASWFHHKESPGKRCRHSVYFRDYMLRCSTKGDCHSSRQVRITTRRRFGTSRDISHRQSGRELWTIPNSLKLRPSINNISLKVPMDTATIVFDWRCGPLWHRWWEWNW